jgi:hypothetical protein
VARARRAARPAKISMHMDLDVLRAAEALTICTNPAQ